MSVLIDLYAIFFFLGNLSIMSGALVHFEIKVFMSTAVSVVLLSLSGVRGPSSEERYTVGSRIVKQHFII